MSKELRSGSERPKASAVGQKKGPKARKISELPSGDERKSTNEPESQYQPRKGDKRVAVDKPANPENQGDSKQAQK